MSFHTTPAVLEDLQHMYVETMQSMEHLARRHYARLLSEYQQQRDPRQLAILLQFARTCQSEYGIKLVEPL